MKRIGLLGGSFDPIHLAHVELARAARAALDLSEVQLIPAGQPWQRAALQACATQRCAMIELAIADDPTLRLNRVEIERPGPTYTVDTLRALPEQAHYVWILGADQLSNFCTWRDWQEIARRVDLAVALRPGASLMPPEGLTAFLHAQGRTLHTLPFPPMPISASEIRRRLALGESTHGMLAPQVAQYIASHNLYR